MADDRELHGLDPFDIQDREAARLLTFFRGLTDDGWTRPSRCEGWTVRDVLGHLASGEDYHQACLDGRVAELFQRFADRGVTDLHAANAMGVADYADRPAADVVEAWHERNTETRRRFRERGDGTIDTSIGDYPNRWQAFHVASELATHADDVGVPVSEVERDERQRWRARFSRFALAESKPDLSITPAGDDTQVSDGVTDVRVPDDVLIEAVAGRADSTSDLADAARAMLSTMP